LRVRKPNGLEQDLKVVERAIAAQQTAKTLASGSKNVSTFLPIKRPNETTEDAEQVPAL
jgi:hypothetical protein